MARQSPGEPDSGSNQPNPVEYLGHGVTWAVSTLVFLWLGVRADEWLGTEPWLALLGAFVGAGAGFYHMYHHLIVLPRGPEGRGEE